MLAAHGFDVCQASDGAQAVRIAGEKGPELVVLDLAMPVMNGLELRRWPCRESMRGESSCS
jgi:DNA-binding response OmpR family regulator